MNRYALYRRKITIILRLAKDNFETLFDRTGCRVPFIMGCWTCNLHTLWLVYVDGKVTHNNISAV